MPADKDDLSAIARIHKSSFSRGWSMSELSAMFAQPNLHFFAARMVGKPGEPILGFNIFRQTAEEAEIISVAVDPAKRGLEVGQALMRDAIHRLVSDRVPELLLEVDEGNDTAVHIYRKLGFQHVGTRPAYYEKNNLGNDETTRERAAALVMRLDLV